MRYEHTAHLCLLLLPLRKHHGMSSPYFTKANAAGCQPRQRNYNKNAVLAAELNCSQIMNTVTIAATACRWKPVGNREHILLTRWRVLPLSLSLSVQSLFGKMINSVEELDAAADAYTEQYLKMNKPNMVARSPVDASEPPRDQDPFADGPDAMEAGGKQNSKAGGKTHADGAPEHASATWLTQCRWVVHGEL